jgi:Sec-independent protein translocase protein TatA
MAQEMDCTSMNPERVKANNRVKLGSESSSKIPKHFRKSLTTLKRTRKESQNIKQNLEDELYSTPKKAQANQYDTTRTKADSLEINSKKVTNSSGDKDISSAAASVDNNNMPFNFNTVEDYNRAIQGIEYDLPGEKQRFFNPAIFANCK